MSCKWPKQLIGDVCSVGDGAHSKIERISSGVPYLTSKNIGPGVLKLDKLDFIAPAAFEKLFSKHSKAVRRPQAGDVLMGIIGTFGNAYLYKSTDNFGFSSSIGILRPQVGVLYPKYLYYVVSSSAFKAQHSSRNAGSAQGYTNIPTIKGVEIPVPPISVQRNIAKILGSLDDKITLNTQTNQTLEQMAQALFKSWFVDFDPVIDNALAAGNPIPEPLAERARNRQALFADSATAPARLPAETLALFPDGFEEHPEMGWIPAGWRVESLSDLTDKISKGTTPRRTDTENASDEPSVSFLKVRDIGDDGAISCETLELIPRSIHEGKLKRSMLKKDDLLFSIAGTIGRVSWVNEKFHDANINQAIAFIRLKDSSSHKEFVRQQLQSSRIQGDVAAKVVQGVQANVSLKSLGDLKFCLPDQSVMETWNGNLNSTLLEIEMLRDQSRSLVALRDTLLPKLLSGELSLPELEAQAESC